TVDGMIARRFGRIVNITSVSVKSPIESLGLSNGARAGLTGFIAGLSRKTVAHNVTINNILPGPFDTDRLRSNIAAQAKASGKTTRRKFLALSSTAAGALGATVLVPAPWREAFGQAKPYKVGVLQPLSGTAAAGGKTALVGTQMAVERINKSGGINGRPIELV